MSSWKPIDFQGIIALKPSVLDHLHEYLDHKERQSATQIAEAIKFDENPFPSGGVMGLFLSDAIEIAGKKVSQLRLNKEAIDRNDRVDDIPSLVNEALWNHVEAIESSATELFQQIDQLTVDQWRFNLLGVIDEIKILLIHKIDDVIWAIRRLGEILSEFSKMIKSRPKAAMWNTRIDSDLIQNLEQTKKFLSERYHAFADRFKTYHKFNDEAFKASQKLDHYHVLSVLDADQKLKYSRFYQLLNVWDKIKDDKGALFKEDIIFALRSLTSYERAMALFKDYYLMLRLVLFERSRNLKTNPQELYTDQVGKNILLEVLDGFREENKTLEHVVSKYRQFLLETDPHPKVRRWWKFNKWVDTEEPAQARKLRNLVDDLESLDVYFQQIRAGVERGPLGADDEEIKLTEDKIQRWLHEMGQPLISKSTLRMLAEKVIGGLKSLDELGSFKQGVSDFVGGSLSKALRNDWKYQVLLDIPGFYDVYSVHQGMAYVYEDRNHTVRLNTFKRLVKQIDEWVKQKTYPKHIHDIEVDMSDIKGYLQDFLAHVQRFARDQEKIHEGREYSEQVRELYRQLLEYRYLFGAFFHELHEDDLEERNIRNQFLFVDQYFESVDNKLQEIKSLRPLE